MIFIMYGIVQTAFSVVIRMSNMGEEPYVHWEWPSGHNQNQIGEMMMKPNYLLILIITATFLVLPACDQTKTGTEKAMDNVDDALDRRPGEKARDAIEDAGDKLEDAGKEIKESVKDATN